MKTNAEVICSFCGNIFLREKAKHCFLIKNGKKPFCTVKCYNKSRSLPKPMCRIDGCTNISRYRNKCLCGMHDMRIRRYGDPHYITSPDIARQHSRAAQLKVSIAKPSTYKKLYNRHEHRVIAEAMIGRPLEKGEIVHHKDGNKHNNSPSNLEVITQSEHVKIHHAEMNIARWGKR